MGRIRQLIGKIPGKYRPRATPHLPGDDGAIVKPLSAFCLRLVAFLLLAGSTQAAPQWMRLKVGMSADDIVRFVGEPLMRVKARGLERWIYDGAGEVVFYGGPVKFWTIPSPTPESDAKPVEEDVMFRPARTKRSTTIQTPAPTPYDPAYADGPRFRYR